MKPGDRVALALMNSAEFLEAYFAIAKIGGVVVPLNWRLVADELEYILKDSGSTTLIFGEEFNEIFQELHSRGRKTNLGTGSSFRLKKIVHFQKTMFYSEMLEKRQSHLSALKKMTYSTSCTHQAPQAHQKAWCIHITHQCGHSPHL